MDVQLFIPCFIDQLYPKTAENTLKILEKVGCKVHYNTNQTCCGQPAFNSGYWDEAATLLKKFLVDFEQPIPIISPSASCTGYVKYHSDKTVPTNPTLLEKVREKKNSIIEITDFLVNHLNIIDLGAYFPHKITYHDSCTALREYGIKQEPRKLLSKVKGLELVEMSEAETCCGFGGTFAVKNSAISSAMAEKKVLNAIETKVEYIVGTESSCLMNIRGYIEKNRLPIKTIHIVDILASTQ